jgi:hypothetical protein
MHYQVLPTFEAESTQAFLRRVADEDAAKRNDLPAEIAGRKSEPASFGAG